MSDFAVEVVQIDEVMPHPNADRLELARVKGWVMVVGKGTYRVGDPAVFFPIDSVLPPELEEALFKDSKIKLHNSRVKTCKIRGVISQGLLAHLGECGVLSTAGDVTKELGVKKYEPTQASVPSIMRGEQTSKRNLNPFFHEYHDIPRLKNCPYMFQEGEPVTVTEKIHGTNFRAGWVPYVPRTLWQKVKGWFGRGPQWEFVYGSRRVQLQYTKIWNGFYVQDVYAKAVKMYDLERLPYGVVVYGEIYGAGIQKGYHYGTEPGEIKLALFDIEVAGGQFLSSNDFYRRAQDLALPTAPVLYMGPFDSGLIRKLASGVSVLCPDQKIIEGVVVKSDGPDGPRKVVKVINEEYDLFQAEKGGTDFH